MGAVARKSGKLAIMAVNGAVNMFVLIVVLALVAFSGYALWDSDQLHSAASASKYEVYKPTAENAGESFAQLTAINPEVFGWLTVYGTHVDYPVTQGEDNWKYVNTSAKGEYSMSGAIFLDAENAADFSDYNSIFYGHHMEKEAMFGEIGSFANKNFFGERQYGNLYYNGRDHGLEFFAFVHADAYDYSVFTPAVGEEQQKAYITGLIEKALHTRDIGLRTSDKIVLLSTCSSESTNGRDILVGRITDNLFSDTFITEEITVTGEGADAQQARSLPLKRVPLWVDILVMAAPVILLVMMIIIKTRKSAAF